MAEILLRRFLSRNEKSENWIQLPIEVRRLLPHGEFKARIGKQEVGMKINERGYMWPSLLLWSQFVRILDFDEEHDQIVVSLTQKGVEISRERDLHEIAC